MRPVTAVVKKNREFDPKTFLATIGAGRKLVAVSERQTIYAQGVGADAVFYIQKGKVKLTVVSKTGKEATIGILRRRRPGRSGLTYGVSGCND